ncbi:porin family protein [Sphingobacterium sp. SGR-19]|uniref:porin family protein n=1 Tax=Sphingobacterium sp. SGR-19 TaxID=2710886 RepID=UPI001F0F5F47|nr:porin family protein [Sphingobacterium sp. SGR-19]
MKNFKKQVKNVAMLLALGLGMHVTTQAQEVEFGIKAGALYNMPSYGNKAVSDSDSKFGFQAGVFARTTEKLYVEGELAFSSFKSTYTLESKKFAPTFYQLNLPLQIGYRVVDTDKMVLRTSIGPQFNYNLKANSANGKVDYKKLNYDGFVNIGTDIDQFSIDLRYNHAINKTSNELESRNRMIGLSLGYRF